LGLEPWLDLPDFAPKWRHVGDEIFDDRHVMHGFNLNRLAFGCHRDHFGFAGQRGVSVNPHTARPANRATTGTPERQGIINRFADFNETIEHTVGGINFHIVILIIRGGTIVLGIETAYAKGGVH